MFRLVCDQEIRCSKSKHILKNWLVIVLMPGQSPLFVWLFKGQQHQFSSVAQSCLTLCDPMDCSMPGFPVHRQLLERTQIHVHRIGDVIQTSHPLLYPSPPAFNLSKHQGLFQWVSSSHQVTKVLEFPLQYQSSQRIFRTDCL